MASPLARFTRSRLASLVVGLTATSSCFLACSGTVVDFSTGGGGTGGQTTTTTSTGATMTTSTTIWDTTATTTTVEGGGGTGGMGGLGGTGGIGATGGGGAPDPWAGPVESLKELDLGNVDFGIQAPFPIPEHTLGFTVQAEGVEASDIVGIYRLRPPVGTSVIFNYAMTGHMTQVFGAQQFITGADPQADSVDAWPVKVGPWKVTLGSDGNSGPNAHVKVWVRRTKDGLFHGGVLDVNLMIVQGVATTSYVLSALGGFFPYAGLTEGVIDSFPPDSSYATIGSHDEYRAMLLSTKGLTNEPAVNLFVVDDFADAEFGGAIGVAGGVPGSPMRHGTSQSGLAYEPSGDPAYDATVLMHEIGHVGGLFHTTEFQIVETDSLSDTPICDNGVITSTPDQCPDKNNVMFPIAYGATTFTNAQLNVLHGSALYRGILEEGGAPSAPLPFAPGGPPNAKGAATLKDDAAELPSGNRSMPAQPDALERALGALWCSGGFEKPALAVARDPAAKLKRVTAKVASARLRAIAIDDTLPVLLRKRALRLYWLAAKAEGIEAQALDLVLAIAEKKTVASIAERRLKAAALRVARAARAAAPAAFAKRIDAALASAQASGDVLLAAVGAGK